VFDLTISLAAMDFLSLALCQNGRTRSIVVAMDSWSGGTLGSRPAYFGFLRRGGANARRQTIACLVRTYRRFPLC
jgi:hypothetical protein